MADFTYLIPMAIGVMGLIMGVVNPDAARSSYQFIGTPWAKRVEFRIASLICLGFGVVGFIASF